MFHVLATIPVNVTTCILPYLYNISYPYFPISVICLNGTFVLIEPLPDHCFVLHFVQKCTARFEQGVKKKSLRDILKN